MTPGEHYAEAERLLAAGAEVVNEIRTAGQTYIDSPLPMPPDAPARVRARRDDLGKQAMGIWAQAQVHATLAAIPFQTINVVNAGEL